MSSTVEAAQPPAVLTLAAPVWEAGGALFAFLEREPSRPVAHMAEARSFAVGTLLEFFCHWILPAFPIRPGMPPWHRGQK